MRGVDNGSWIKGSGLLLIALTEEIGIDIASTSLGDVLNVCNPDTELLVQHLL